MEEEEAEVEGVEGGSGAGVKLNAPHDAPVVR